MKSVAIAFALVVSAIPAADAQPTGIQCDIGPINRNFGNVPWLVYSCNGEKTIVMVSAPGGPAMPFVFVLHPDKTAYRLEGEGTGSKVASDAAGAEIQRVSAEDLAGILAQTKQAKLEADKAAGKLPR